MGLQRVGHNRSNSTRHAGLKWKGGLKGQRVGAEHAWAPLPSSGVLGACVQSSGWKQQRESFWGLEEEAPGES